jgi:hypothetical protein
MKSPGLYRKFRVTRTDGSSRKGKKHADCSYFVLDLEHDPFAIPALRAYAEACRKTHPDLADDIEALVLAERPDCGCREAGCPHVSLGLGPSNASEMAAHIMQRAKAPKGTIR